MLIKQRILNITCRPRENAPVLADPLSVRYRHRYFSIPLPYIEETPICVNSCPFLFFKFSLLAVLEMENEFCIPESAVAWFCVGNLVGNRVGNFAMLDARKMMLAGWRALLGVRRNSLH